MTLLEETAISQRLLVGEHEVIVDAFTTLLTHKAGFALTMFADLWIHVLEDGRFSVSREKVRADDRIFDDAREAVEYFLARRAELELGLDFEYDADTAEAASHE